MCICYYNLNYGSMLQAYATVKEVEKRGLSFDIIHYKKQKSLGFLISNAGRVFNSAWRSEKKLVVQKKLSLYRYSDYKRNVLIRNQLFRKFQNKYFDDHVVTYVGFKTLAENAQKYDIVLSGSDQMWSPSGLATNFFNLMFVPAGVRKISYASSFGVSQIPYYQRKRTAAYLKRINYISLREERGVEIVRELTGREAQLVVDPTMLLSSNEWDTFSGHEPIISEKYIFAYFLGDNKGHRTTVEDLKKNTGLKIVTLRHLDEYIPSDEKFGDYAPYNVGPEEFLNLIKNAEYVCTDSFHGTVFATLFHKQFLTYSRFSNTSKTSRNSRINTLLSNLGLENRLFLDGDSIIKILEEIDYVKVEACRAEMIRSSKQYLDDALHIGD